MVTPEACVAPPRSPSSGSARSVEYRPAPTPAPAGRRAVRRQTTSMSASPSSARPVSRAWSVPSSASSSTQRRKCVSGARRLDRLVEHDAHRAAVRAHRARKRAQQPGAPNSSKVTSAETGLPGSPSQGTPNSRPNPSGAPGRMRTRQSESVPPSSRDDAARVVEVPDRYAARGEDHVAALGGAEMLRRARAGRRARCRAARALRPRRARPPRASSCSRRRCAGRRAPRRTRRAARARRPWRGSPTRGRRCTHGSRTADGGEHAERARGRARCRRASRRRAGAHVLARERGCSRPRRGRRGSRPWSPDVSCPPPAPRSPRPRGTGAPVMMRAASPRTDRARAARCPRRSSRRRAAVTGEPADAPRTSAARTAKPSMLALSHGGSDTGETTSRASTRPSESRSATTPPPSGATPASMCALASRDARAASGSRLPAAAARRGAPPAHPATRSPPSSSARRSCCTAR